MNETYKKIVDGTSVSHARAYNRAPAFHGLAMQPDVSVQIIDGIADQGYAIVDGFLPQATITGLAEEAKALHAQGEMHRAATGK